MNSRFVFILLLSAFLPAFLFFENNDSANTLEVPKEQLLHVKISVVSPQRTNKSITIDARGIVEAQERLTINVLSDGIFHPNVVTATYVKKAELIGTVTNPMREHDIGMLNSKIELLKSDIDIEEKKMKSIQEMLRLGILSKNDLLSQESKLKSKKLLLVQAKNELQRFRMLKKSEKIYAPKSGYIESISADGIYMKYGSNVATITSDKTIVRIFLDPKYINKLKILQDIKLLTRQGSFNAKLSSILPKSSSNLVEIIANTKESLSIGLSVEAKIEMSRLNGWIIPKDCIVLEQNRAAIYIINDSIAHIHFISIQKDMIDRVFISDDINEEDKIAFKSSYMLHDGMQVEVSDGK